MYYKSKDTRALSDQKLGAGLEKNFGKSVSLVLKGEKHTIGEILSMLEARKAAGEPVAAAKSEWQKLVEEEREVIDQTQPVLDALRQYLVAMTDANKLSDYGITTRKRRGLTSEKLAAKAKKARATRKARRQADASQVASATPQTASPENGGT